MAGYLDFVMLRVTLFIPVILALTVHEWAHARVALALGDDTALQHGRLTLNPLAHLDPIGTLLPLLGVPFGWAKPVPIDPSRFRPEVPMSKGLLLAAAAGPVSNLVLALLCGLGLRLADASHLLLPPGLTALLEHSTVINIALAIFNLLPITPLDGSRIVDGLIPFEWRRGWDQFSRFGFVLLLLLFLAPAMLGLGSGHWLAEVAGRLTGR